MFTLRSTQFNSHYRSVLPKQYIYVGVSWFHVGRDDACACAGLCPQLASLVGWLACVARNVNKRLIGDREYFTQIKYFNHQEYFGHKIFKNDTCMIGQCQNDSRNTTICLAHFKRSRFAKTCKYNGNLSLFKEYIQTDTWKCNVNFCKYVLCLFSPIETTRDVVYQFATGAL
jgi:hypothetical protein